MNVLLLQYKDDWYRADPNVLDGAVLGLRYFDLVVAIEDDNWKVIKNRHGEEEEGVVTPLMQVKMFAMGKTIQDLPTFYMDLLIGDSVIAAKLEHDKRGNLKLTSTTFNEA